MARTKAELLDVAEHAAGNQIDQRMAEHLVDEAGHELCNAWPWAWLHRPETLLSLTKDQNYITLPSDFQKLIDVTSTENYLEQVHTVELSRIHWLRGDDVGEAVVDHYVALEYPGQPDTTSNPAGARLAIYPTPTEDRTDRFRLEYRAGWPSLANMDDVANVPPDVAPLLTQFVRAYALGYVDEQRGRGSVAQRVEPIYSSTMFKRLAERYGGAQGNYGQLQHGIVKNPYHPRGPAWLHDNINVS